MSESDSAPRRQRKAAPDRTVTRTPDAVTSLMGFTPPNSIETERRVLGYVLMYPESPHVALAEKVGVKARAFWLPAHRVLWQTIGDMRARGLFADAATLYDELKLAGQLDAVGGLTGYAAATATNASNLVSFRQDCERLRLLWEQRATLDLTMDLRQGVIDFATREEFAELLSGIGQRLIRFGRTEASMTMQEHIEEVEKDFEKRILGTEDRSRWIFTGLPTFDKRLKPLNSAKLDGLTVIGGGSGHGKSAIVRQWAWSCLKAGGTVLFYTLETDLESLIEQMVSSVVAIDLENIQEYAKLYPDRAERFRAECKWLREEVAGKRLWMVQHGEGTKMETIEDLESHYRAHANLYGHPHLVVVDYLQILGTKSKARSREETVATVSHGIKRLKLEAGNCWLVPAQLNETGLREMRAAQKDANGKIRHHIPGAGALRESQAIYHDADRVIMLYCPPEDCRGQDNWGGNTQKPEIWLCQIKRKKGSTGWVKCWFEKKFTRFIELGYAEVIEGEGRSAGTTAATPAAPEPGYGASSRPTSKAAFLGQQPRKPGGVS